MPGKRRNAKSRRRELTMEMILELSWIGWHPPSRPHDRATRLGLFTIEDVRDAWNEFRTKLMADYDRPGKRPWGWWRFDSPEPRDESVDEAEQLRHLGLLEDWEERELARVAELKSRIARRMGG